MWLITSFLCTAHAASLVSGWRLHLLPRALFVPENPACIPCLAIGLSTFLLHQSQQIHLHAVYKYPTTLSYYTVFIVSLVKKQS